MPQTVSVIIPCYNQAQYLPDALESVINQTYSHWECIIVSDGSTDNIEEVVEKYIAKDSRFNFYHTENGGPSAARNFGISKASGKYILPLDGDDKISTNYIEECVKAFEGDSSIRLVYGAGEKFGIVNCKWELPDWSFQDHLFNNIVQSCAMYKKQDYLLVGGYDELMKEGCEDWEFWINLLKKGGKVVMVKNSVFFWRRKESSRTTSLTDVKISKLQQYIYKKHIDLYEPFFNDPIDLYKKYVLLKKSNELINDHFLSFFISKLKVGILKFFPRRTSGK